MASVKLRTIGVVALFLCLPATAIAQEDVCTSEAFTAECEKAATLFREVCDRGKWMESNTPSTDINQGWLEAMRSADETIAFWEAYKAQYSSCTSSGSCRFDNYRYEKCIAVKETFKGIFASYFEDIRNVHVESWKRDFARLDKNPLDPFARTALSSANAWLDEAQGFAAIDYLEVDTAQIDEWRTLVDQRMNSANEAKDKELAKVKCPKASNKDKKMTSKLEDVLIQHFADTKKPDSKMEETVKKFGLSGKATKTVEKWNKVTHEDIPGFACVEQVLPRETNCRILEVTFRRTKPDGGSWGEWAFYSVGGGDLMSCRKLN